MEITYFGHSCFRIKTKTATIVTDPYDPAMVGLKYPKLQADIVTLSYSHQNYHFLEKIAGEPFVIAGPGEYEIKEISVFGIESSKVNTIYLIETENLRICHLGNLVEKLGEEQIEEVNGVDILFVPVGGIETLDPRKAGEVVSQVEPLVVIPHHYQIKGMSSSFKDLATVDDFTKELGVEVQPVKRLFINQDKLPEEREVVVLERKSS